MKKKDYIAPVFEIIHLERKNVITESDWKLPPIVGAPGRNSQGGSWDGER